MSLIITPTTLTLNRMGEPDYIYADSGEFDTSIDPISDSTWLSGYYMGTGVAYAEATANQGPIRTGHLTFTGDDGSTAVCTITQAGAFSLSPSSESRDQSAGSILIEAQLDNFDTTITPTSDVTWLSGSFDGDEYAYATYTANTGSTRTGHLVFTSVFGFTATFTLVQEGHTSELSVSPSAGTYTAAGGSTTLALTTNESVVNWSTTEDWCRATINMGSYPYTITIVVDSMSQTTDRTAGISFTAGTASAKYDITQTGAAEFLTFTNTSGTMNSAGTTNLTIPYSTNYTGTVSCSSGVDWCTVTKSSLGDYFVITCTANTSVSSRSCTITGTAGSATATYSLVQEAAGYSISVSPTSGTFTYSGGTNDITITSNDVVTPGEYPSYVSISGSGSSYHITCTANSLDVERSAVITFYNHDASATYSFTQASAPVTLTLSPMQHVWDKDGGNYTITYNTNYTGGVTAISNQDWCTVTVSSSGKSTIKCTANTGAAYRYATVTYTAGSVTAVFNVSQACDFIINPSSTSCNWHSTSIPIVCTANALSSVVSDVDWLSGTIVDSTNATATVQENRGDSRTGHLTFTAVTGGTTKFTLVQNAYGAELSIDPTSGTFSKNGETKTISLSASEAVSYSSTADWCTAVIGSSSIDITCTANSSITTRTATVTFTAGTATAIYSVTQEAADIYLTFTEHSGIMNSAGTTSLVITYSTNYTGSISFSSDKLWCTIDSGGVISCEVYTGSTARTCTITGSAGSVTDTYILTQNPVVKEISISPVSGSFNKNGGSDTITITANGNVTVGTVPSWIGVSITGSTSAVITVDANTTDTARSQVITFYNDTASATYTVNQVAGDVTLSINPVSGTFSRDGEQKSVTISTNYSGTVSASSNVDWCTVTVSGTTGNISCTLNDSSDRSGIITFTAGGSSATYSVHQVGIVSGLYPLWDDCIYTGSTGFSYTIKDGSDVIYEGITTIQPGASVSKLNVSRLVHTTQSIDLNSRVNQGIVGHSRDIELYIGSTRAARYCFVNDWSYDDTFIYGNITSLSKPINSHIDDRQLVFGNQYVRSGTYNFYVNDTLIDSYTAGSGEDARCLIASGYTGNITVAGTAYKGGYCGRGALYYRNLYGGYDSFLIEGNIVEKDTYTQEEFNDNSRLLKSIKRSYELHTGLLTDAESEILANHLLSSVEVYFDDFSKIHSCYITDSSVEHKVYRNGRKLNQYTIGIAYEY